jgi:hypothetical protein
LHNVLHGIEIIIMEQNAISRRKLTGCRTLLNGFD